MSGMHIPPVGAMACWTTKPEPRLWVMTSHRWAEDLVVASAKCRAWRSKEDMITHNGDACAGCARLPEEFR